MYFYIKICDWNAIFDLGRKFNHFYFKEQKKAIRHFFELLFINTF